MLPIKVKITFVMVVHLLPLEPDFSFLGHHEEVDALQQRTLPCPGRTDQDLKLSFADGEGDPFQYFSYTKRLLDVLDSQYRLF
jgi:hypothetical protein